MHILTIQSYQFEKKCNKWTAYKVIRRDTKQHVKTEKNVNTFPVLY